MNYKGYFFVNNLYMSEKQFGIQAAHCLCEMFNKYNAEDTELPEYPERVANIHLNRWSQCDKTIVLLKGHNHSNLNLIYNQIESVNTLYPYAKFCEDVDSLNGATTCVGIILPEKIHSAPKSEDDFAIWCAGYELTEEEIQLSKLIINSYTA